jgi:hypothetical protein
MYAHFTAPENLPFAVALGLFFLLGSVQTLSLLTGLSIFGWLDNLLPDLDADGDAGIEAGAEAEAGPDGMHEASFVAQAFAWLNFGRVPFMVSFLAFLFLFACVGYNLQLFVAQAGLDLAPAVVAAAISFAAALYPLRWLNALLGRVVPKDETSAISVHSLLGRVATITIGEATHTRPAEAKVKGPLGRTHYLMVRADQPGDHFRQGEQVLLVAEDGTGFTGIAVANVNLETQSAKPQ